MAVGSPSYWLGLNHRPDPERRQPRQGPSDVVPVCGHSSSCQRAYLELNRLASQILRGKWAYADFTEVGIGTALGRLT